MTTSRSKSYGLTLADAVKHSDFALSKDDDLTLVAAQGLLMAYLTLSTFDAHFIPTILDYLERVWRATLVLRAKQPADSLDESMFTRFGRFRGMLDVEIPDLDVIEEDVEVEGVKRPICRPKVRKRRRKIRGK